MYVWETEKKTREREKGGEGWKEIINKKETDGNERRRAEKRK